LDIIADSAGCSIDQLCPCEGPRGTTGPVEKPRQIRLLHGKKRFVEADLITEEEKDAIVSDAAQSDCGDKQ